MSKQNTKDLLTIHQVAKLLGISTDSIRLYEKAGLVKPIRNPDNGYRYYDFATIQQIMGVCLYRKVDVSLQHISELFQITDIADLSTAIASYIDETDAEIDRLQKRRKKLEIMQKHVENIASDLNSIQVKHLDDFYITYRCSSSRPAYTHLEEINASPFMGYGQLCFEFEKKENQFIPGSQIYTVRKQTLALLPDTQNLELCPGGNCLYGAFSLPLAPSIHFDLQPFIDYASSHQLTLSNRAYFFYVMSLNDGSNRSATNYYEAYFPLAT